MRTHGIPTMLLALAAGVAAGCAATDARSRETQARRARPADAVILAKGIT